MFTYEIWYKSNGILKCKEYLAFNKEEAVRQFAQVSHERIVSVLAKIQNNTVDKMHVD